MAIFVTDGLRPSPLSPAGLICGWKFVPNEFIANGAKMTADRARFNNPAQRVAKAGFVADRVNNHIRSSPRTAS
jgi:hypothetical protein